ncbi:MerR family transcriptional regulator, partial [Pseudoflavonifractor phocaeensis]|uniref:MerR family transcriptional regulator n=1 Tax=Pseudoflavonifractor phocaeensis TaxID=1870988 RepID=UPI0019592CFC
MTIKELETLVNMPRTSIRYYEREGLISPIRASNNYRSYTLDDADALQKIKLLRKLHLEVDTIRLLQEGTLSLDQALADQLNALEQDRAALEQARQVCSALRDAHSDYAHLDPHPWLERLEQE